MLANVVWRSLDTYALLPVEKYELTREPRLTFAAAESAFASPRCLVMSPELWKTTVIGACAPVPNVLSVRWFASYAENPGIENCSSHRLETALAEYAPTSVSAIQTKTIARRRRSTRWARADISRAPYGF